MLKSNMILEASFLAGTDVEDAVKEAKEKAIKYDLIYVRFNFNGVLFSIGKTANVKKAVELYPKNKTIVEA